VGYVCWQRPRNEELVEAGLSDLPSDHVDVDIFLGEPETLGLGIGAAALRLVFDRLRSEGVSSVGLGTAADNQRARRAFEKAGFKLFREFEEEGRRMCYFTRGPGSVI
jgi:RimJ/RimL family protein N-acetyltransferase